MKIETRPVAEITPYGRNPRRNDDAVDAVAESITRFGFRQPIVVDADGVIVCGHTRWKAAQKLGLEQVPVHVASDLTPEQVRAYRIADNKTGELAEFDVEKLAAELEALVEQEIDWTTLGFGEGELERLLGEQGGEAVAGDDGQALPLEYKILVECRDEEQQRELIDRFAEMKLHYKAMIV